MPDTHPVIDAHQHFWNRNQPAPFDYTWQDAPRLEPLQRNYLPEDLKPLISEVGVHYTVHVQSQHHLEENRWALDLAERHELIAGVVGWVDLASSDCERQLLEFKDHPKFVGIRHVTEAEPDDDFIVREEILRGLKVLEKHRVPFDLLFYVRHLHHADRLGRELPELPMVLDHLGKPNIAEAKLTEWLPHFKAAAAHPNIYCKLSGMVTEADWRGWEPKHLKPYVQAALDLFGPDRCMFGSDWPVCNLAGSYGQVYHALNEALGSISDDERRRIFGGTAASFYGLPV